MKTIALFISIALSIGIIMAPATSHSKMIDTYRTGKLTLTPDPTVSFDAAGFNEGSSCKSVAVANDGSVFAATCDGYSICKYSPDGDLLETFGGKGSGDGYFRNRPTLYGVLDNRYVFTTESNGRINVFDVNGSHYNTIELDYMPLDAAVLSDGRVGISGWVAWSGDRVRLIAVIVDIHTGEEEIVLSRMIDDQISHAVEVAMDSGTVMMGISHPFEQRRIITTSTSDGRFVVGMDDRPTLKVFDTDGDAVGQLELDIERKLITQKEKDEFFAGAKESLTKHGFEEAASQVMQVKTTFPDYMPYYYNVIVDAENNFLVFIYTEDEDDTRFQVYSDLPGGRKLCEAQLDIKDATVTLNPACQDLVLKDNYAVAAATLKRAPSKSTLLHLKIRNK